MSRLGIKYSNGKVWIFKYLTNSAKEGGSETPSFSVDIREILAMCFVGTAAIALILKNDTTDAMLLLVGMLGYATGRTVPTSK